MPPGQITATVGDLVCKFTHDCDVTLQQPVMVTRHGKPCNVLISIAAYERRKQRAQRAFVAARTPEEFLARLTRFAATGE